MMYYHTSMMYFTTTCIPKLFFFVQNVVFKFQTATVPLVCNNCIILKKKKKSIEVKKNTNLHIPSP